MPKLSANGHIGLAWETTYGTAVVPTTWLPYNTLKSEDAIKKVNDTSIRAALVKDMQVYNTTRQGQVDMELDLYPEPIGYFIKAILGAGGYSVTGTGPYTHTFKVSNTMPQSLTLSDYSSIATQERSFAGSVINELGFKFDTGEVFKANAKFMSKASTLVTATTPTYTATNPFLGFQATLKLGGTTNANLIGGEFNIKRDVALHFTATNTQDVAKFSAGRIEITGKLSFIPEDETELLIYLNGTQQSLELLFTRDANTTFDAMFNKVDFTKANVDRGSEYIKVDAEFRAIYNSTDAGNATFTLKNTITTY